MSRLFQSIFLLFIFESNITCQGLEPEKAKENHMISQHDNVRNEFEKMREILTQSLQLIDDMDKEEQRNQKLISDVKRFKAKVQKSLKEERKLLDCLKNFQKSIEIQDKQSSLLCNFGEQLVEASMKIDAIDQKSWPQDMVDTYKALNEIIGLQTEMIRHFYLKREK